MFDRLTGTNLSIEPTKIKPRTGLGLFCRTEDEAFDAFLVAFRRAEEARERLHSLSLPRGYPYLRRCLEEQEQAQEALEGAKAVRDIDYANVFTRLRAILSRCKTLSWPVRERIFIWLELGFHAPTGVNETAWLNRILQDHLFDYVQFRKLRRRK